MALEIYENNTLKHTFPRVLSATLADHLSGERTLSFSVLASRSQSLQTGMTVKLDGQYYNIVRVSKQITDGFPITTAECEHISYLLNDEQYNLVTFVLKAHRWKDFTNFSMTPHSPSESVRQPDGSNATSPKVRSTAGMR